MSEASGAVPAPPPASSSDGVSGSRGKETAETGAGAGRPPRPAGNPPLTRTPHRTGLDHLDVVKALEELQGTSMAQIERTTALTWGGRAAASYKLTRDAQGSDGLDLHAAFRHFYEGENYRQEALEHAAMAEDRGELLLHIHDELEVARGEALAALEGPSGVGAGKTRAQAPSGKATAGPAPS